MCGIIGYIGDKFIDSVLIVGLERLEYRGYDSAGIATISNGELLTRKEPGKLKVLDNSLKQSPLGGKLGIGHTRWATHGVPSKNNAHPHLDCKQQIAIAHNGIIENYILLKDELIKEGHVFESDTDSEVIAHLLESYLKNNSLKEAVTKCVNKLEGSFAIVIISELFPDKIIAIRNKSPIVVGLGKNENLVASDIGPLLINTNKVVYLEDKEIAIITKDTVNFLNFHDEDIDKKTTLIETELKDYDKQDFKYFMLKEIYEQPDVANRILKERIGEDGLIHFKEHTIKRESLAKVGKIIIQACGTSWHAGLVGKFLLEKFARIPTEVEISSEFRYRNPILEGDTLIIAISQSGETADTLAGIREAKSKFARILSFVNVENSTIAKESDSCVYLLAGPEIGVASTKAYVSELINLFLFTLYISRLKWTLDENQIKEILSEIKQIPDRIEDIFKQNNKIEEYAKNYSKSPLVIFLGRGVNYPTALEGALKLKEISYLHSIGYPAGEFKHGPIALVDENVLVVCILPQGELYSKMLSNVSEVKARKGKVIAVATIGDETIKNIADSVIYIPKCSEIISPILAVVPLQLFAYYTAVNKGCDVDKPRNLAKSVTVE